MQVRFRTIGDTTCTGANISTANDLDAIIDEVARLEIQKEGQGQMISALKRNGRQKKQGYF